MTLFVFENVIYECPNYCCCCWQRQYLLAGLHLLACHSLGCCLLVAVGFGKHRQEKPGGSNSISPLSLQQHKAFKMVSRASCLYQVAQKSTWPEHRGPQMVLDDSKLIINESKWSSRIDFVSFRTFRGPIFCRTVTSLVLFLPLGIKNGSSEGFVIAIRRRMVLVRKRK